MYHVYTMKQTWSKLRAHVVHVYFEYICFMFDSSCKTGYSSNGHHRRRNEVLSFYPCRCVGRFVCL